MMRSAAVPRKRRGGENRRCTYMRGDRARSPNAEGIQPAMFDLTFLGTSASVPSAERNHPRLLVEAGSDRILVDCGEGTQRQLLRSGAGFRRLDRLLLTHGHFDHVLGIPGLLSTLRLQQSTGAMTIHAGASALDGIAKMF